MAVWVRGHFLCVEEQLIEIARGVTRHQTSPICATSNYQLNAPALSNTDLKLKDRQGPAKATQTTWWSLLHSMVSCTMFVVKQVLSAMSSVSLYKYKWMFCSFLLTAFGLGCISAVILWNLLGVCTWRRTETGKFDSSSNAWIPWKRRNRYLCYRAGTCFIAWLAAII